MTLFNARRSSEPRPGAKRIGVVTLALAGLALSCPVHAAGSPDTTPNSSDSKPAPPLLSNPAETLAAIANHLNQDPDVVVATVDNRPITQGDAADVVRSFPVSLASLGLHDIYGRAMDVLIRQKAMVLNAEKQGLDKDPSVVHQEKVAVERVLAEAWLNRKADAAVTEDALHARYDRDVAGKPGPDEVRARVILVPARSDALDLIVKLQGGADFAGLARQFSKDPTAAKGGDLGYLPLESVSPEVGSAMFSLAPGQLTPYPVNSLAGYFIVRVEGRRQRATPTFDAVRARLERELRAEAVRMAIASLLSDITVVPIDKAAGADAASVR
jgi:peptidyl-prolyl cis-trans isomerase C